MCCHKSAECGLEFWRVVLSIVPYCSTFYYLLVGNHSLRLLGETWHNLHILGCTLVEPWSGSQSGIQNSFVCARMTSVTKIRKTRVTTITGIFILTWRQRPRIVQLKRSSITFYMCHKHKKHCDEETLLIERSQHSCANICIHD